MKIASNNFVSIKKMKIASRGLREYKETHTYTFRQCSEVFPIVSYSVSCKVVLLLQIVVCRYLKLKVISIINYSR